MTQLGGSNFAAHLVARLGPHAELIDAAQGLTISAQALPQRIVAAASELRDRGLRPGARILLACTIDPECAIAYLGAMYAGLVVAPYNPRAMPKPAIDELARRIDAAAIWSAHADHDATLEGGPVRLHGPLGQQAQAKALPQPCAADALAALMLTSGSTGAPRLVEVSHGNLLANTQAIVRSLALNETDRAMLVLPISYCFGASVLHSLLHQGGSVVFDSRFMFADRVLEAMQAHGCTTFAGVPTAYTLLLDRSRLAEMALPKLRRLLQAGGHLPAAKIMALRERLPHADFHVMYGQTEATARIACLPQKAAAHHMASVGLPLDNLHVRVVAPDGSDLPRGEIGELWVRGPSVCKGYFDDPLATAQRFVDGWLRTGDLVRQDAQGYLWIEGRQGDFLKMRGVRMGYAQIEATIASFAEVADCAVTSVAHEQAGEALLVFVVARGHQTQLAQAVRRQLPRDWTCAGVHEVASLPRNAQGKLDRAGLQALVPGVAHVSHAGA